MAVLRTDKHPPIRDDGGDFELADSDSRVHRPCDFKIGDSLAIDLVDGHVAPSCVVSTVAEPAIREVLSVDQHRVCDWFFGEGDRRV